MVLIIKKTLLSNEIAKLISCEYIENKLVARVKSEFITIDANKSIHIYNINGDKSTIRKSIHKRTVFNINITDEVAQLLLIILGLSSDNISIHIDNNKLLFTGKQLYNIGEKTVESERTVRIPIQVWKCTE